MNYVKELVDKHKYSKYRIKKIVGVSWVTVSHWYRGVYSPNHDNVKKLNQLLENAARSTNND